MRPLLIALVYVMVLYADMQQLVYVSNDANEKNLENLYEKYKKTLLINDRKVYLIPSDCLLERYFGGTSQGRLILSKKPQQTEEILVTQEVFEANDVSVIKEKIETDKSLALIEGKVPKAFLDDKEGRGFGGASETPLDFSFQKLEAKKVHMKPATQQVNIEPSPKAYLHPTCKLLKNGSGYVLEHINNATFYSNRSFQPIKNPIITFK